MEVTWPLAGAIAVVSLIAVLEWQRRVDRKAWQGWSLTFGGVRRDLVEWLRRELGRHLGLVDATLSLAWRERTRGGNEEAAEALCSVDRQVATHAGVLCAWLRHCMDVAHRLSAIEPVPRLPIRRMQLGPLRALALGHYLGDAVLVTSGERYNWTTKIQAAGLRAVTFVFGASALRARSPHPRDVERAFDDADRARADLDTLNEHVVTSLEHLCAALESRGAAS